MNNETFSRTQLLVGSANMEKLANAKVIVFGIGGVGSWCAEALVRSGITHITIVDADCIAISNVNRQIHATTSTVDQIKVDVMRKRLLDINPDADVKAIYDFYSADNYQQFDLDSYDFIIDAIDSLQSKLHLIRTATATKATFFSSMGAARKMDPSRIKVAEFWKVFGCPLGASLRRSLRKEGMPSKKFMCVFSDELVPNLGITSDTDNIATLKGADGDWNTGKVSANGALVHITAIFGLTLASLVIRQIVENN